MRSFFDISYGNVEEPLEKLDIHLPDEGESFPVFIYFHGGGIYAGDKASENILKNAKTVTDRGIAFVSVNYKLYPNTKYPEFIDECEEAVSWISKNIESYCKCSGLYVGGSSAGGYISMMLCFDKSWLAKYGMSPLDIKGYIHDAGQPTAHFTVLKYAGIDSKRVIVDETAPLYHIGTSEEYSNMLFIVSDNDRENRYEQTMLTISTLRHFGHTEPKVQLKVMNGKHCAYTKEFDDNGIGVFGTIVADYIESL